MDTPNDDEKLGPDDLNLNLNPSQPSGEEKTSKKTEDSLPVVKKDYTALIIAIGALLIAIGFYAWQNYQKRKDDENTIDSKFTDLGKENETFNDQRTYE